MQAGQLRHRVTIQAQTVGRDSDGGEIVNWTDLVTVWAAVEPQAGQERHLPNSDQMLASRIINVRIRKRELPTAKMQVLFGSQILDIQQVIHVETRNRELILVCEEKSV